MALLMLEPHRLIVTIGTFEAFSENAVSDEDYIY